MTTFYRSLPVQPLPRAVFAAIPASKNLDDRIAAAAVMLTSFLCFLPYPALNIGNTSALQMGNVLSACICVPLVFSRLKASALRPYLIIILPLIVSSCAVALGMGIGKDLDVCLKNVINWAIAGLTLVATIYYAPRYSLQILTGIALATLLHVAVGAWQFDSFMSDEFPLADLYVNRSFLSVQDNVTIIARYIQRPFGLFPEPSAMSSSLAPWLLLFTAILADLVKLPVAPRRWQLNLFALATVGGVALVILSRSGHAAFLLAGLALVAVMWLARAKACAKTYLVLVVSLLLVVPGVLWSASQSLGDRLGGKSALGNSSWEERATSLQVGFDMVAQGRWTTTVFGMGAGLSSKAISDKAGLEAVWSVLLTYVYETGLIGAIAVGWIALELLGRWRTCDWDLVFAAVVIVWVIGITLTTSYAQLLPLWLTLGWLLVWPTQARSLAREVPR